MTSLANLIGKIVNTVEAFLFEIKPTLTGQKMKNRWNFSVVGNNGHMCRECIGFYLNTRVCVIKLSTHWSNLHTTGLILHPIGAGALG